ncbi:hypothetical protein KR093_007948 [Drosophila rubida]|uniref:Peptidase S1 domain-containing protein n=1 Tax=Drosophila rubida TaxID=30044 RepID=A0AAD4K5K6_9MUSC|nr:hypothetical protein KR093_007948 [Drosophila rubida]
MPPWHAKVSTDTTSIRQMLPLGCGFANPQTPDRFSDKPADAQSTRFGEFPWLIKIMFKNEFLGGGTLIAPDIVLTAASLIDGKSNDSLTVVAGEWNANSETEIYPHLERSVQSVIQHAQFDGIVNDIALLVLRSSFSRQPNIHTVCLDTPQTVVQQERCLSVAWTQTGSLPRQNRLAVQARDECSRRMPSPFAQDNKLDAGFICATHLDDSPVLNMGAALFCPMEGMPNQYTQVGIVIGSINRTSSGVFVNMNHYMPWIFLQLGPRGTDLRHYLPFV